MALSFKLYVDAALAVEQSGNLIATQNADGSSPAVEFQLWLGSLGSTGLDVADRKLQADSDPGVDPIILSVADSDPGNGHEATEIKLALTQVGLATAVAGAPLNLPATINSAAAGAVEFWIQADDATMVIGTSTELSVTTVSVRETDI